MSVTLTQYIEALDACGVSDLSSSMKTDFINLARTEVVEAYAWPFRESVTADSHGTTITDPWTTPITGYGTEYVKPKYVYSAYGQLLKPMSEIQMAGMGVQFSPDETVPPSYLGQPEFFAVYYVLGGSGTRETYVIPYPYGAINVVASFSAQALDLITNTTEGQIPAPFKMLVVYGAAVHAYLNLGVTDLAESYRARYAELMQTLINNQMTRSFEVPDISYPQGA